LKSSKNRLLLSKEKTDEARAIKLDQLVKLNLVSKFFDKENGKYKTKDSESESGSSKGDGFVGGEPINPKANPTAVGTQVSTGTIVTGSGSDTFKIARQFSEDGDDPKRPKVNVLELPSTRGDMGADMLEVTKNTDSTPDELKSTDIITNGVIGAVTNKSRYVLQNGDTLLDYFGSEAKVNEFLSSYTTLNPNQGTNITYLPVDAKTGKPLLKKAFKAQSLKLTTREAYIKSIAKKTTQNRKSKIPANKLYSGSLREGADTEYLNYQRWAERGLDPTKYEKAAKDSPNDKELQQIAIMARDASNALNKVKKGMENIFGGQEVSMIAHLGVGLIFTDDGKLTLKDKYDKSAELGNFAKGGIRKAEATEETQLQDVAKKDPSSIKWSNVTGLKVFDEVYATTVFIPLKSADVQAAYAGQKTKAVQTVYRIQVAMDKGMNSASFYSTRSIPLAYKFIL